MVVSTLLQYLCAVCCSTSECIFSQDKYQNLLSALSSPEMVLSCVCSMYPSDKELAVAFDYLLCNLEVLAFDKDETTKANI